MKGRMGEHAVVDSHEGPIGPGSYSITRSTPMDPFPQSTPGAFRLGFRIGEDNPLSGGRTRDFYGDGGRWSW